MSESPPSGDGSSFRIRSENPPDRPMPLGVRLRRLLFGRPRDIGDRSLLHRLALVPFLAWVGMGADGLSSSCYGPEEAFRTLGEHTWLAVALALAAGATVCIISLAYSRIIEDFPHGGGGYVVATKLLGERAGVSRGVRSSSTTCSRSPSRSQPRSRRASAFCRWIRPGSIP